MSEDHISLDEAGRWDGDVFVFVPPIIRVDERGRQVTVRRVDCSQLELPDDVTREDAIHALLNSIEDAFADDN